MHGTQNGPRTRRRFPKAKRITSLTVAEYFTQERLDRYRDLHRKYPLWCGHWPNELAGAPERTMWTFRRRVRVEGPGLRQRAPEVQAFRAERRLAFVALRHRLVERRTPPDVWGVFLDFDALRRSERFEIPVTLPAPEYQLVQAIAYALARWPVLPEGDSTAEAELAEVDPIEVWAAWLSDELRHCFPVFGEPFERKAPYRWSFGIGNEFLQATKRGDPERQRWVDRLRRGWLNLGEHIGIVPRLRGGAKCGLGTDFLAKLDDEICRLAAELRAYVSKADEQATILRLVIGDQAFEAAQATGTAVSAERYKRGVAGASNASSLDWASRLMRRHGIECWAIRLAFPMLDDREIAMLRGAVGVERQRTTPAWRVLAARLGLSPRTLENLLAR